MKKMAERYAIAFYDLGISPDDFKEISDVITGDKNMRRVLLDPSIPEPKKEDIITKLADRMGTGKCLRNALLYLCRQRAIGDVEDIYAALKSYSENMNSILNATLYCVTEPDEGQRTGIESWLKREFHKDSVKLVIIKEPKLLGGFIIEAEGKQFDWSVLGSLNTLKQSMTGQS